MSMSSFLKPFSRDRRGNTAIIFALSAVPMVMMAGGAIDVIGSYKAKARLQTAVDAAALAAASARNLTKKERKQTGRKVLRTNFAASASEKDFPIKAKFKITKKDVTVTASTKMPTTFLRMAGISEMDIAARAVAKRDFGNLELALVLDNTYSMTGSKIKTLRKAARKLVKSIYKADDGNNIRIAVVPFTRYVRIDTKYKTAPWLKPPHEYTYHHPKTCKSVPEYESYNCHTVYRTSYLDGILKSWHYKKCDERPTGRMIEKCSSEYTVHYTWKGCVGSRAYPLNAKDESYGSDRIIPLVGINNCPQKVKPLTDKSGEDDIITIINDMTPRDGQTYIPAGLIWGWRALSAVAPFDEGKPYAEDNKKALVLMTDGANTVIAAGKYHNSGPSYPKAPEADTLTAEICENIKKQNIRLYTVAFEVTDPATKDMLESCATSPADFFDATDDAKLLAAFKNIAKSLQTVYLAR